jgi:hypothetical protein
MAAILFEKKWLTNYRLLNAKGNLLVLVYVYSIFPPFPLHLALPLVMPCTLVHLSILKINNTYKIVAFSFSNL